MFNIATFVESGIIALIILVVGLILSRVIKALILHLMGKSPDKGAVTFVASAASLAVKIMMVVMILDQLGINSNVIVGAFSACALGISLALKQNMADVAGGMQIILTRPFRVGDFVEVMEYKGTIRRIEIMYTVIESVGHSEIIIPNSKLIENTIRNYTKEDKVFVHIQMVLSASIPIEHVQSLFYQVLKEDEDIVQEAPMKVEIDSLENGLSLGIFCAMKKDQYPQSEARLKKKLQQVRLREEIALPSQTVVINRQVN